ncbi:MAG: 2'-5' RNA ligase family protein [Chloroflexota bacterium]|nr:2'-5' RNA ligase family protein [Chloroflexota bacterium]
MEQDEAFRRVWQTLRSLKRLADGRHDTPGWRSHNAVYAICVIRVPAAALQPNLDALRKVLGDLPFVRIHPDHFLHITLQELGFVCDKPGRRDEISPARIKEFVSAATGPLAEQSAFKVRLGGVNSYQDAAFLDVHDGGQCARVHQRLRELAAVPTIPRFAYLPHMTIAHYIADVPVGNLPAILATWRDHTFGTFTASVIEVVTLPVNEAYPPMTTVASFPLRS